jgi:hypothetical protein
MAAVTRRQYKGAAAQTTITNALASGDTSATLAATTGWPSGADPFFVVISPGTASEEKCSATISGSVLTLTRAQDDTSAQSHSSGATIYPVFTADDADEANKFASTMTTRGDLVTMGSGPDFARIAIGSSGQVLKSDGTDAAWAVDPATDLVTTKGDLLVATAADTLTRLPVGIDGYRVTAASGETGGLKYDMPSVPVAADASARDALFGGAGEKVLAEGQLCYLQDSDVVQYYDGSSWATVGPASASPLVYITQGTFSAVSSVSMAAGTFTSTYKHYKVLLNITSTSGHQAMGVRVNVAGSAQTGSNYYGGWALCQASGAYVGLPANGNSSAVPIYIQSTTFATLDLTVYQPTNASVYTRWSGSASGASDNNTQGGSGGGNMYNVAEAHDGLTFVVSGTFGGTYYVYGIKDS